MDWSQVDSKAMARKIFNNFEFLRNYGPDPAKALIVYGGYNHGSNTQLLNSDHGGLDVYVRRKPAN